MWSRMNGLLAVKMKGAGAVGTAHGFVARLNAPQQIDVLGSLPSEGRLHVGRNNVRRAGARTARRGDNVGVGPAAVFLVRHQSSP